MNIILFYPSEVELPLPRSDPRARHLLDVLHRRPGDQFDAGLIDGPRGKGTLVAIHEETLTFSFTWSQQPPPLVPLNLIIGLPRPQTARDILREATALGVASLHFVRTEKGEPGYATSSLWKTDAWRQCLVTGAAQAFCTRLPRVTCGESLATALTGRPAGEVRLALDNYEAPTALSACHLPLDGKSVTLALGSERGWSAAERGLLRENGFIFAHLGERVLRTETACIVAVALLRTKLGWL